ncbi:T9SS type A sorting domain-containing protein [uncultured Kordia sp.]|uniref:T9SS type A sorting domain-containing protein n=1 Tax=uncultured Kordia sp. TaxID=507699 RepID=UPI0026187CF8|nr:T9SS type A sorting domain-containing protein [uncultured Kordia sp.]
MKQKLLFLVCILSAYFATAQAVFPDTFEFRGINSGAPDVGVVPAPGPNPAGLDVAVLPTLTGRLSAPVLVDLDGDGDLDMVSGAQSALGKLFYYENTGSPTAPNWVQTAQPALDAVAIAPGGNNETKGQFVDIDDDGDFDLFLATKNDINQNNFNDIHYFENTGSATAPNFVESTIPGILNQNIANFPGLGFVDLDDDDDLDMVGMGSDSISYLENTGTKLVPMFERRLQLNNPWDMDPGIGVLDRNWPHGDILVTFPDFQDVDRDGDFDLIMGTDTGIVRWVENVGTAMAPDFGTYAYQNMPGDLETFDFGQFATVSFGDINNDGVLDAILGSFSPGYFAWFEGVLTTPLSIEEEDFAVKVNVSPNPVSDLLTIQFESNQINKTNITMYTITGQMVYGSNKLIQNNRAIKIDVSQLTSGLYFLKIKSDDNKTVVKKITVN